MFEIKLKELCESCPELNATIDTSTLYADGKVAQRTVLVECRNRITCDRIEDYLKNRASDARSN